MKRSHHKKRKSVRNQKKRFQKSGKKLSMRGGDLSTSTFSVPISRFYPLNSYDHDPSFPPQLSSERLTVTSGGSRSRRRKRTRYNRNNKTRMRGGSANLTSLTNIQDPIVGGPNGHSLVNVFGNVAGSGALAYSLLGQSPNLANSGGMIHVASNASTMA